MSASILVGLTLLDRILKLVYINSYGFEDGRYIAKGLVIVLSILIMTLLRGKLNMLRKGIWYHLMLIGGISNLMDLIFYKRVVDYFPIFNYLTNLADVFVSVGILLLICEVYYAYKNNFKG